MSTQASTIEQQTINTIRTLAMDAVEAAASGHPGTPMALAPVAYRLWSNQLRFDPESPDWPARDRFVLSCGHASMLLYALLHLAGVKQLDDQGRDTGKPAVSLEDIKNFRQWGSRCPGHPESHLTSGVETTTGPLGQGIANSVGMAVSQSWLAATLNRPGFSLFDYNTYAICSDGDLMEGIGSEAASLAGHLKLANLCWIYDDNHITIDGETRLSFSEDVGRRFEAYGWHVARVDDANDLNQIDAALAQFAHTTDRPTLIIVRSHIAWGAPHKQDTSAAHGAPLGEDEIRRTKAFYGWPEEAKFLVPEGVAAHLHGAMVQRGGQLHAAWNRMFEDYHRQHPEPADMWRMIQRAQLPDGWDAELPVFPADAQGDATRNSGGKALNALARRVPWLLGGSADLAASNKTTLKFESAGDFSAENRAGRNLHFGIREHAMAAIVNGMTLSRLRAFGATFLVFSDYCRPALRMAALMRIPSIFVFTHDSIGVGEDGPTHQPVEHLAALRAIPNMLVIRPGDANEASQAWRAILELRDRPACLILTRQNLPTLDRQKYAAAAGLRRGGYVLADAASGRPEVILIGTGSERSLVVEAGEKLAAEGIAARIVSMPCCELFDEQPAEYQAEVLPPDVGARVAVEAGISQGWDKYLGVNGRFVGVNRFGASAPYKVLFERYGLTVEHIVTEAKASLSATS